jgi:uncharacterized membrane protein
MSKRPGLLALLPIAILLLIALAPSARSAGPAEAIAKPAPVAKASVTHSALKATTFKVGAFLVNMAVFSAGTGSLVGGTVLTVFNVSKSWALFTANDYLWDKYDPSNENTNSAKSFNPKQSFWRTTLKFMTYKPVDTAIKFASLYLWTGSASVMLIYGSTSAILNTGVFYVNNVAWDAFDWWTSPASSGMLAPHRKQVALQ